jgi:hypothetical protein
MSDFILVFQLTVWSVLAIFGIAFLGYGIAALIKNRKKKGKL